METEKQKQSEYGEYPDFPYDKVGYFSMNVRGAKDREVLLCMLESFVEHEGYCASEATGIVRATIVLMDILEDYFDTMTTPTN